MRLRLLSTPLLTMSDHHSLLSKPVYAYVLQIIVVANHMSGKDTHVRGLRVLGPLECISSLVLFFQD